jgi:hypothetical protein
MTFRHFRRPIAFGAAIVAIAPASSNSLVPAGPRTGIAKSTLSATPVSEWNKLSRNDGQNTEVWTIDGDELDKVTFFGGIVHGKPLLREVDRKHRPLPKVKVNMLLTDVPALLESTYRVRGVTQMNVDAEEPAMLGTHKAIRFTYSFTRDDEVVRKGEGIGSLMGGKLYLVTYEAPVLHFFDKDVEKFRKLAATLAF